jgi:hypothetical protein
MLDSVRLAERTGPVAVTGWHDRLYLAWVGSKLNPLGWNIVLAYSPDGREIMGTQQLDQHSYGFRERPGPDPRPSLDGSGEHLYLAWTGTDEHINILTDPQSPHGAAAWLEGTRSWYDPALCSHQGSIAVAWTASNQRLAGLVGRLSDVTSFTSGIRHISILTDAENPHSVPIRLEEARSARGPALCSHQGSLVLAWTGTDGYINILTDPHNTHDPPIRLEEAWSSYMPALCSHQGSLVLAWAGGDEGYISILTDPHNPHDPPIRLDEARSKGAPALCSYQDSLILAWPGTGAHLNLARLQ